MLLKDHPQMKGRPTWWNEKLWLIFSWVDISGCSDVSCTLLYQGNTSAESVSLMKTCPTFGGAKVFLSSQLISEC